MDSHGHCNALVRAADKDRYLAGLFAPAAARCHLYALYAFAAEIVRAGEMREPLAAEIRLQWWREVLAGERCGESTGNPIAAALLSTVAAKALPTEPLLQLIDAHGSALYGDEVTNLADLDAFVERTVGILFAMSAAILLDEDPGELRGAQAEVVSVPSRAVPRNEQAEPAIATAARQAGIAYGIAQRIANFPHDTAHGKIFVSNDILAQHGVARADIEARLDSAGLRAALAQLRGHAQHAYVAFVATARAFPDRAAPAFLVAALVPLMLAGIGENSFVVIEVPQWRRQWRLWRAARRWPKVLL
jgi:phytoene synthase